uniref:Shisa N-terminal domain-containing protein n=1 Tax=Knipowitschia caucasica TaxID=637954 RepID=A0AAV2JZ09_KNICA
MGIGHVLLLLMYLDPLCVMGSVKKTNKPATRKPPRTTTLALGSTATSTTVTPRTPPASTHDTCLGYYDVSGQYDKMFECNNTDHRYCCGTCFLRFCCEYKKDRLNQRACDNYQSPKWVQTAAPSPVPTGDTYDPSMDQTNTAVYITCGVIAFIIVLGVSVKVAYDKATEPPQEMNIHRALADILRQQGPIPISQYDCENFAAMNGSPKDNTPVRTSSKNHYTPVHGKSNHGLHYGKESVRSSGGADLHNFISSGFVTLGRGHQKATPRWHLPGRYVPVVVSSGRQTRKMKTYEMWVLGDGRRPGGRTVENRGRSPEAEQNEKSRLTLRRDQSEQGPQRAEPGAADPVSFVSAALSLGVCGGDTGPWRLSVEDRRAGDRLLWRPSRLRDVSSVEGLCMGSQTHTDWGNV